MSDVGQVYGLASAALAALALLFVGMGIMHQARQTKISQIQASRAMQFELVKMAIDDPTLQDGWSRSVDLPYGEWRLHFYLNLIIQYLRMTFVIGEMPEKALRRTMANRYQTQLGRDYWQRARHAFLTSAGTRREHDFYRIAEDEYQKALRTPALPDSKQTNIGKTVTGPTHRPVAPESGKSKLLLTVTVAGMAAFSAVKWLQRRNR